jgi:hypothetical protein
MKTAGKKMKSNDAAAWPPPKPPRKADWRQYVRPPQCRQDVTGDNDHRQKPPGWPPGYEERGEHILVRLPKIPPSASVVPWLTSLHATDGRGPYGDAKFRGNCSGLFIRDLLDYFGPGRVLDPMAGSGTCGDVCQELNIPCVSFDLAQGFDATDAANFESLGEFDFVWLHPPYYCLIRYREDSRCLSQSWTLDIYLERMRAVLRNCGSVLSRRGVIAVLIGDAKHAGKYWGLPYRVMQAAEQAGLWLAAPEIIRFGHGAASSRKFYRNSLIPLLHDVCWVLRPVRKEERDHE